MNVISFFTKRKVEFLVIAFFLVFLPLFSYNLGNYSLVDFDEGWFAEVARNVLVNRSPIILTFNSAPFTEHPPLGFDLIALSYIFFGINEFAARFPSAILGWGCLILVYLIGKNLINRWVGLGASLILVSSVWFIFRARSGNLDSVFLFFFLLTFYFSLKMKKNSRWIYGLVLAFAAVFLVKTLIGVSISIPVLVFLVTQRIKIPKKRLVKALFIFALSLAPWIAANLIANGWYYFEHLINVGLRRGDFIRPNLKELGNQITFQYLHFGIGKWYSLGIVSFLVLLPFAKKIKTLLPIYALLVFLIFGFLTNAKTEIWHLIPIYPFWGILISSFVYFLIYYSLKVFNKKWLKFTPVLTLLPIFLLSFYQISQFKNGIQLSGSTSSGLASVSAAARNYKEDLYLDNHFFLPSTVFYSQKKVLNIRGLGAPRNLLKGFIKDASSSSLLLTQPWRLEMDKIDKSLYKILAQKEDWMLIKLVSPVSK